MVVTTLGGTNLYVLMGNGNGTFQAAQTFYGGNSLFTPTVADLNGDGHPDIVAAYASGPSSAVTVLLSNGNGTYKPRQTFITGQDPLDAVVADVNGDGKLDIVTANYQNSNVSVLLGNGNGTFQSQLYLRHGGRAKIRGGEDGYSMAMGFPTLLP